MADQAEIAIAYLYPQEMNLYGDRGNIIALTRRAEWRGIQVRVEALGPGEEADFRLFDLAFMGGGQDREQALIAVDFTRTKRDSLLEAVAAGMPLLAVCGGYQLLGRYYRTADGQELPGVGLFDAWTEAGDRRMIGNVVVETDLLSKGATTIVGFENHAGRTFLGPGARPLGRVRTGFGNNGQDRLEGAVQGNAVGTYLHGSLLPKNPRLADWLLTRALDRARSHQRGQGRAPVAAVAVAAAVTVGPPPFGGLAPLDDVVEERAHQAAIARAMAGSASRPKG